MAVRIYRGTTSPSLTDTITVDGVAFDLTGSTVEFQMRAAAGGDLVVDEPATVVNPTAGTVRYDWDTPDTAAAGDFIGWWRVTLPSTRVQESAEFPVTIDAHGLSPKQLCTIEDVKLARRGTPAATDDLIEDLILDASEVLTRLSGGRQFVKDEASSAHIFRMRDPVVEIADLSAAPSLIEVAGRFGGPVAATLTLGTQAILLPAGRSADEPIEAIELRRWWSPANEIRVTGVWGWPSVPRAARQAAIETVVEWLRADQMTTNAAPEMFEPGSPPQRGVPMKARDLILPLRRALVG